jgi:hypothetical protein
MMVDFDLVLHHRYSGGTARDLSGHGNHGHLAGSSTRSQQPWNGGLRFDGRDTRVVAFPSDSLDDLGAVRIRARMLVAELGDRRTIAEGYLAFSFAVEPEGSLSGALYDGTRWHRVVSPTACVALGRWVDASFVYDGEDTLLLVLDGVILTRRNAPVGAVRGVAWPYGLNIGAWPDQNLRMFRGMISEVWIWRHHRTGTNPWPRSEEVPPNR